MSCFGWIFVARPLKRTISPIVRVLWRSSAYFFCESQRALRWSNSVKGRARILKEKEERNASPVSAFCSAKDRPSRKLFIPPLWLGNLNFRSHVFERKRESERDFLRQMRLTRASFTSSRDMFSKTVSFHCDQDREPESEFTSETLARRKSHDGRRRARGMTKEVSSIRMRDCNAKGEANRLPPLPMHDFILFARIYTKLT